MKENNKNGTMKNAIKPNSQGKKEKNCGEKAGKECPGQGESC